MAIAGESFCKSAYNGLLLQVKHGAKFAFGNYLAQGFITFGKIGLTSFNVFLTWLFMKHITGTISQVTNIWVPMAVVALTSYMICSVFLGLFDESVLAMMSSFAADLDLNGGPKWGPASLHDVVDNMYDKY